MDFFFNTLKKGLVATLFVVFTFVATYTPQLPTSHVPEAEAGGLSGIANIPNQLAILAKEGASLVQNTITAGATGGLWVKENVLDGIGWAIAKRIVSGIIRSLINWVNSGFQGSPSFVQDFKGFLLNIADEEIGRVIEDLGGIGSFICSPFRLDVQVSVAMQYAQGREQQTAPSCTLTGIIDNIEGFISGIDPGNGLSDWIQITSTPQTYTPYGAVLSAQAHARARIINAKGEEISLLGFADGFLSKKLCQTVQGTDGKTKEANCKITLPGKVIADQLNNALDTGRQTLVEADEINELIAALLGQLANQALTGVAGLLGLSGGDGFGGYSSEPSYLDDLVSASGDVVSDSAGSGNIIEEALNDEREFQIEIIEIQTEFTAYIETASDEENVRKAGAVVSEIDNTLLITTQNIADLDALSDDYETGSDEDRIDILIAFTEMDLTANSSKLGDWKETADDLEIELE